MDAETRLLRIAARQYSVFSNRQALSVGISSSTINRRAMSGRWQRILRGVYVDASTSIGWEQRLMAALLRCGDASVASFGSAGLIWALVEERGACEVTVPYGTYPRERRVVVHRTLRLEGVAHRAFRVTHPMRTLLDLASRLPDERLENTLDEAHRRRLIDLGRLAAYLDLPTNRTTAGSGTLRSMVSMRDSRRIIGSTLETVFFRTLREARLPLPTAQHPVRTRSGSRYIDFAYPDALVAIELDGYAVHADRSSFDGDRLRQNELVGLGWRVLRFTWTQVTTDPLGVVTSVGSALGLHPVRWA